MLWSQYNEQQDAYKYLQTGTSSTSNQVSFNLCLIKINWKEIDVQ